MHFFYRLAPGLAANVARRCGSQGKRQDLQVAYGRSQHVAVFHWRDKGEAPAILLYQPTTGNCGDPSPRLEACIHETAGQADGVLVRVFCATAETADV